MKKISVCICFMLMGICSYTQQILQYHNPILSGFYPDPSICKAGNDYYIVNSSFAYFPGLPIFHSKDLVNWQQVGNAMNRAEQLNLDKAGVSRGLYAPAISYHKGVFYIVCTLVDKGGNFVITATNPAGPWSNPVWLPQVNGIDPSLFFDADDKAYICYNSIPPNNTSLYSGHRTIRMYGFDYKNLKISGEEILLVNGGTDINKKPVWIEGPHLYSVNDYYYLLCAEGGTGYQHSEVVFRSKRIEGPYESFEKNPILTQRHLDPKRKNPVTTTGHADLIQTNDGKWYVVFLGCRPYSENYYNIGRETFMLPVTWKDGWPVILESDAEVESHYPVPMPDITKKVNNPFNDAINFKDDFLSTTLNNRWLMLRNQQTKWYALNKGLTISLNASTLGGTGNPSFLAVRQQQHDGVASTSINFKAITSNEKAGLAVFQNETHYYFLCKSVENNIPVVQLYQSTADSMQLQLLGSKLLDDDSKLLQLKIEQKGAAYAFYYATKSNQWQLLKNNVDATFLSTSTAGGFVGCVTGPYATSLGMPTKNIAVYNWFNYSGTNYLR